MKKKVFMSIIAIFVAMSILFSEGAAVEAASKITNFGKYNLSLTSIKKFSKKMGLKKAKNKNYSYFVKNKNTTVGYNKNYNTYDRSYGKYRLFVKNSSSKVSLWGIRPGMKRSDCRKKYKGHIWGVVEKTSRYDCVPFGFEHGGDVYFYYKNGKLQYWDLHVWYSDARW